MLSADKPSPQDNAEPVLHMVADNVVANTHPHTHKLDTTAFAADVCQVKR